MSADHPTRTRTTGKFLPRKASTSFTTLATTACTGWTAGLARIPFWMSMTTRADLGSSVVTGIAMTFLRVEFPASSLRARELPVLDLGDHDREGGEPVVIGARHPVRPGDAGVGNALERIAEQPAVRGLRILDRPRHHVDAVVAEAAEDADRRVLRIQLCERRDVVVENFPLRI